MHDDVIEAYRRFNNGEIPYFSTGICESITAGFGECDEYGYFQYPLVVDQKTYKVVELKDVQFK